MSERDDKFKESIAPTHSQLNLSLSVHASSIPQLAVASLLPVCATFVLYLACDMTCSDLRNHNGYREILRGFIQLYRSEPCLWDVNNHIYRDRELKKKAYAKLVAKLKQIDPKADRAQVVKKINVLRSNYRKEHKKVVKSKLSGNDNIYVPNLWYYKHLTFLNYQPDSKDPTDNEVEQIEDINFSDDDCTTFVSDLAFNTTSDLRNDYREILTEFIQLYRSEPCLWDVNSKIYRDKELKRKAYVKLAAKLKQIDPKADRAHVVKKINVLRSSYRQEHKKVIKSKLSGNDNIYVPSLWYYKHLTFLNSLPDYKDPTDNEVHQTEDINFSGDDYSTFQEDEENLSDKSVTVKNEHILFQPEELEITHDNFSNSLVQYDRYEMLGKMVTLKMRGLPKQQMLIAEKIINETLFEAEMGTLTSSHKLTNE